MSTRVAMWCGPRTISTAMMRAWENRPDTVVSDEPLYACYLERTGLAHPGREEIIESQSTDYRALTEVLSGPTPDGKSIWYQKHMAHHLLPGMDRSWMEGLDHCLLIRDPKAVVASYARARPDVTLADIGIVQQLELARWLRKEGGHTVTVIDSRDVLEKPAAMLKALCRRLGVPWTEKMLHWPAGPRASDGVWAPHWYASVERSTGFAPYPHRDVQIDSGLQSIVDESMQAYRQLHEERLQVGG